MKINSILILLINILQTLIVCDIEGVTQESLKEAFITSLPYIKSFHPNSITSIGRPPFHVANITYEELTPDNVEFRFDEFENLYIKFVNLKLNIEGQLHATKRSLSKFKIVDLYKAKLYDVNWEEKFWIRITKKEEGKYELRYSHNGESKVSFKVASFIVEKDATETSSFYKSQINRFSFHYFEQHLKKLTKIILKALEKKLK